MISMNAWNNLNLFRRNTIYFQSSPVTDSNPVFFPTYVLPCDKIFREAIIQRSGLQAIFDLKFTGFPAKNSSPYQFFPAFFLIILFRHLLNSIKGFSHNFYSKIH